MSTEEKAASQTLPPFNHLGEKIEWRLSNVEGGYKPFATILRLIEEEAMKDRTGRIIAQVPVDVGTFLLNEKRLAVREIEARCRVHIEDARTFLALSTEPYRQTPLTSFVPVGHVGLRAGLAFWQSC